MTKAQCVAVAGAIINAGYVVETNLRPDGQYVCTAKSPAFDVLASTVVSLATAQGVTAFVQQTQLV